MIAPTSSDRIALIAKETHGFLYAVSSPGSTEVSKEVCAELQNMVSKARNISHLPCCAIGYDISTPQQAKEIASLADGIIIGNAVAKLVEQFGKQSSEPVKQLVGEIKIALDNNVS